MIYPLVRWHALGRTWTFHRRRVPPFERRASILELNRSVLRRRSVYRQKVKEKGTLSLGESKQKVMSVMAWEREESDEYQKDKI